jgi:hypothetical protein
MDCSAITEMARRLERLERQGDRWKWAALACGLSLTMTFAACTRFPDGSPKIIRAGSFVVVNDDGNEVVRISSDAQEKGQGLVEVLDKSGKPRIRMGLTASDRAFHMLIGQNPRDQLILDAIPEGGVGIRLADREHNSGVMLTTSPEGIAAMGFMSPGGKLVLDMGVNPDATSRLIIRDATEKVVVRLPKH